MNELLNLVLTMNLSWLVITAFLHTGYYFYTVQEEDIKRFDDYIIGMLPGWTSAYKKSRFGIFTLLFTYIGCAVSGPLQFVACLCIITIWITTNLVSFAFYLPLFAHNLVSGSTNQKSVNQKHQIQENAQTVSKTGQLLFINETLLVVRNLQFHKSHHPVFMISEKIITSFVQVSIVAITLVPRLLLTLVNMIDRYFFGRAMLNQDFYWLMMKTGSEEFIDNTKGHTTPLRKAIQDLNVRAIRALANDPNTNINEVSNEITLLEVAMAAKFESGIKVILEHPKYKLYAKISDLVRIGMDAITKKNKKVFVHILKHIDNTDSLISLLEIALKKKFSEGVKLITQHKKFNLDSKSAEKILQMGVEHQNAVIMRDQVKIVNNCSELERHLDTCIKRKYREGVDILINSLFEITHEFKFLLPHFSDRNLNVFEDVIKSMQPEKKKQLYIGYKEKIRKSVQTSYRNTNEKIKESISQVEYLKLLSQINYESLAMATGLNIHEFEALTGMEETYEHMKNNDCTCPVGLEKIQVPVKIKTRDDHGIDRWEKEHYEFEQIKKFLSYDNAQESMMTRMPIQDIKLAVEEYSEALILAMLAYAISENKETMIDKIKAQKFVQSDGNRRKIDEKIASHRKEKNRDIDKTEHDAFNGMRSLF